MQTTNARIPLFNTRLLASPWQVCTLYCSAWILLFMTSCTSPAPTTPDNSSGVVRRGCDHCLPRSTIYDDEYTPVLHGVVPTTLKINANYTTLAFRKENVTRWQYFYDFETGRMWHLESQVGLTYDSLQLFYIDDFLDWSPYDPDLALVLIGAKTGNSPQTDRYYTLMAIFNVREARIVRLAQKPIPYSQQFFESSVNTRWIRSSRPGNDTIVHYNVVSGLAYRLHVQSGTKTPGERFTYIVGESSNPARWFALTVPDAQISGLRLKCLQTSQPVVRSFAWSPDARYLSLVVRNLNYDSIGRNLKDTVFFETWPCANTELWVFDVDQLMATRDLNTQPLYRTNFQETHCLFYPRTTNIVSTPQGSLLVALQPSLSDRIPIYELSLDGTIIREVVSNP